MVHIRLPESCGYNDKKFVFVAQKNENEELEEGWDISTHAVFT